MSLSNLETCVFFGLHKDGSIFKTHLITFSAEVLLSLALAYIRQLAFMHLR